MPQSYAPIIAGSGGVLLEAPDTLPESGVLALAVNAAGKMSSVAFPSTTRETLGLATTDAVTFSSIIASSATSSGVPPFQFGSEGNRTGLKRLNTLNLAVVANAADLLYFGNDGVVLSNGAALQWKASTVNAGASDLLVTRDAAGTLAQRNSTNGQKSRIYKTYTSATSGEWLEFDAATDASNFDIAACVGSAGGSARGIRIGSKNSAGTFTPAITINPSLVDIKSISDGLGVRFFTSAGVNVASLAIDYDAFGFAGYASNSFYPHHTTGGAIHIQGLSGQTAAVLSASGPGGTLTPPFKVYATGALEATTALFAGTVTTRASTTAAGTAPIKIATGTLMTTPEAGAIEYDGTNLYFTDSGGTRRQIAVV